MREVVADSQSLQHVAGLEARTGAGGPAGTGDVLDSHHEGFTLDETEGDIGQVR